MMLIKISKTFVSLCLLIVLSSITTAQTMIVFDADTGAFFNSHELKQINHLIVDYTVQKKQIETLSKTLMSSEQSNITLLARIEGLSQIHTQDIQTIAISDATKAASDAYHQKRFKKVRRQRNNAYIGIVITLATVIFFAR